MKKRITLSGVAAATALMVAAGPAGADVLDIPDPTFDAFVLTTTVKYGDYDIDLTNVRVDHQPTNVVVTSTFSYTNVDSWTQIRAQFDLNGDRVPDYAALWGKDPAASGVLKYNPDGTYVVVCTGIGTSEAFGVGGSVTMTVPRGCIGSPAAVAVHLDVTWIGTNTYGYPLSFGDSAPGQLIDSPVTFSAPVPVLATAVVPSPAPPAPAPPAPAPPAPAPPAPVQKKDTSLKVAVSSKTQNGRARATVTVRLNGPGEPEGKAKFTVNGRLVKQLEVWKDWAFKVRLPGNLKPGVHLVKVSFTPSDPSQYNGSSKTVRLKVRR